MADLADLAHLPHLYLLELWRRLLLHAPRRERRYGRDRQGLLQVRVEHRHLLELLVPVVRIPERVCALFPTRHFLQRRHTRFLREPDAQLFVVSLLPAVPNILFNAALIGKDIPKNQSSRGLTTPATHLATTNKT